MLTYLQPHLHQFLANVSLQFNALEKIVRFVHDGNAAEKWSGTIARHGLIFPYSDTSYPTITCSTLATETLEQGAKYVYKLTIKTPEPRHWRL